MHQIQQLVMNLAVDVSEGPGDAAPARSKRGARRSNSVFEPFFTTKAAGRGLGLASAHGIARAHRGTITVTSAPHEGATFRVSLPVAQHVSPAYANR